MKRSFTARTIAGIAALTFMLSCASCANPFVAREMNSSEKTEKPEDISGDGSNKKAARYFKAVEFGESPASSNYIEKICRIPDSDNYLIKANNKEGSGELLLTDEDFLDYKEIEVNAGGGENSETYFVSNVAPDGTIFVAATVTDYGDFKMPDWNDPNFDSENFDYDAMQKAATTSYKLMTFDKNGEKLTDKTLDLSDYLPSEDDDDMYITNVNSIFPCDSETAILSIYSMEESFALVGTDGKITRDLDFGDNAYIYTYCYDEDSNLYFTSWEDNTPLLRYIDTTKYELSPDKTDLDSEVLGNITTLIPGNNGYDFYAYDSNDLYGLNKDGSYDKIFNWLDSDLNGQRINSVIPCDNGDFIAEEYDYNSGNFVFYRLTERDSEEFESAEIINLAVLYTDDTLTAEITKFNKSQDDYRIRLNDYSKYYKWNKDSNEEENTPTKQLKLDISAGKCPDMIAFSDPSLFTDLASKDVFVDLYDFLGTGNTISKEDIISPVLKGGEINGKLVSLTPSFSMSTLAVKSKYCSGDTMTFDEFTQAFGKLKKDATLFRYSASSEEVFNSLYKGMNFVDRQKGTCSFDSPDFIKLLEFCDQFKNTDADRDWEKMTDKDYENYEKERQTALRNDKAFAEEISISGDVRAYKHAKDIYFNDDITLIGFPSADGGRAVITPSVNYAIFNNAKSQDVCWEFISRFFTEEYQMNQNDWALPSYKKALDKKLDETMSDPYYTDQDGKKQTYKDTEYMSNEEVEVPNFTKEERDFIANYIENADVISNISYYGGDEVSSVVYEETQAFFAGERSAEETAKLIQNRVSIMVSEQS